MRPLPAISTFLALTGIAVAQTDQVRPESTPAPKFDVASIKPAGGKRVTSGQSMPGGGINLTNVTLQDLIVNAWHVLPDQISGGPAWISTARYDISAKPDKAAKPSDAKMMMQRLLADRFGLAVHREMMNRPIYALVIARKDGRLGPSLVESKEGGCAANNASPRPLPEPGKLSTRWCGLLMMQPRRLSGAAVPLVALAEQFSARLGRSVVDMTGLKGNFDINLEWTTDEGQLPVFEQSPDSRPPLRLSFEFDALYRRFGFTRYFSGSPWTIDGISRVRANSWEFPMILKYGIPTDTPAFHPFVGGGYAPRTLRGKEDSSAAYAITMSSTPPYYTYKYQSTHGDTNYPMTHGIVGSAGVDFSVGHIRVSPELRYVHWGGRFFDTFFYKTPGVKGVHSQQDEVFFLLGISWR